MQKGEKDATVLCGDAGGLTVGSVLPCHPVSEQGRRLKPAMNPAFWNDKTILITGGTGSFGAAFLDECSRIIKEVYEVRVFSRDEKKQDDLRKRFTNPKIKFIIGDVRDKASVDAAMVDVDYVFHAAALKHVPTGENHPFEVVKTNIIGSHNVIESAIEHKVRKVVVLSTDKAVGPTCAMGMTKGLMEKCALARCLASDTEICVTRFGNVMGSRNSVIPLFAEQLRNGKQATVTDPRMVRYMMTMQQAQRLVIYAFERGQTGETFVLNCPVASVMTVLCAVRDIVAPTAMPIEPFMKIIGARQGEKMREELMTAEEAEYAYLRRDALDIGSIYCIPYIHEKITFSENENEWKYAKAVELNESELKSLILGSGILEEVTV